MDAPSCIAIVAAAGAVASPTMVPVMKPVGAPQTTASGQSIEWFAKDIIAVGRYEHRDGVIDVDEAMLDTFVKAFEQMTAGGVDVEFTLDHSDSAADVLGFIRALYRVGDRLWGTFEVRGWDAVDCVGRNRNVSAEVSKDFVDGKGNHYGPAIFAVSLVKAPVVAGQAEFVRLGRGRPDKSDDRVPLLVLSRTGAAGSQIKRREGDTRWFSRQGGTNMTLLATVAAALGLTGLTEDNAATMLGDYAKQNKTAAETAQATLSRLQGELEAAKAKIPATLSRVEIDMIEERADIQAERIDALVGSTIQVDAGIATVFKDAILGKADARPLALFSRPQGGGKAPVVAVVDSLVKAAKPATLSRVGQVGAPGAKTPAQPSQAAHLSRVAGGGGDPAGGAPAGQEDVKAGLAGYASYLGPTFKAPDAVGA